MAQAGFVELPVTLRHALAVKDLPPLHRDPFDRLLVAQALLERLVLVTHDRQLAAYPAETPCMASPLEAGGGRRELMDSRFVVREAGNGNASVAARPAPGLRGA